MFVDTAHAAASYVQGHGRNGETFHLHYHVGLRPHHRPSLMVSVLNFRDFLSRRSFSNLVCFTSLQTLVLDKNDLEDIKACPSIPTLTTLWFNNNRVSQRTAYLVRTLASPAPPPPPPRARYLHATAVVVR